MCQILFNKRVGMIENIQMHLLKPNGYSIPKVDVFQTVDIKNYTCLQ